MKEKELKIQAIEEIEEKEKYKNEINKIKNIIKSKEDITKKIEKMKEKNFDQNSLLYCYASAVVLKTAFIGILVGTEIYFSVKAGLLGATIVLEIMAIIYMLSIILFDKVISIPDPDIFVANYVDDIRDLIEEIKKKYNIKIELKQLNNELEKINEMLKKENPSNVEKINSQSNNKELTEYDLGVKKNGR